MDNGSADGSTELVRAEFPGATVVALARNRGFGAGVNAGLERSSGEFVLLLNNDATVEPEAVGELLRVAEAAPDVGSVAAQMRFADRPQTINSAGIGIDRLGVAYDRLLGASASASERAPVEVFGASGGAALWRRVALESVPLRRAVRGPRRCCARRCGQRRIGEVAEEDRPEIVGAFGERDLEGELVSFRSLSPSSLNGACTKARNALVILTGDRGELFARGGSPRPRGGLVDVAVLLERIVVADDPDPVSGGDLALVLGLLGLLATSRG